MATKKSTKRNRKTRQDADLEALWRKFARSKPPISQDEMRSIEVNFSEQMSSGVTRRMALGALTRSGKQLRAAFGKRSDLESVEVGAEMVASIESYREFLRNVMDMLETARTRVQMAMCEREDMSEVLAAARKRLDQAPRELANG